jgi:hypothetical protein
VRTSLAAASAIAAIALAGCAGSDDEATTTQATTTSATPTLPTLEGAATVPVEEPGSASETALLTHVRVARHEGFDRVVFEFRNMLPGYRVEYVEGPLAEDGSGNPVELEGSASLVVRMARARRRCARSFERATSRRC